jgi:two-component system response regulator FixJ
LGEDPYYALVKRDRLVHIVDTDLASCEALSVLFRLEGFQTAFSLDASSFFSSFERRRPDAVVLDAKLGSDDGIGVLRRIKQMRMGTPVFMLASGSDVDDAVLAMKAGAFDVITKPVDTEYLARAVTHALRRDVRINTEPTRHTPETRHFAQLTPREREVLRLITDGKSNKEAGRALGISPRTVEVHRARIMEKLAAKNTADLMRIVLTT